MRVIPERFRETRCLCSCAGGYRCSCLQTLNALAEIEPHHRPILVVREVSSPCLASAGCAASGPAPALRCCASAQGFQCPFKPLSVRSAAALAFHAVVDHLCSRL